jgi:hypothetical protein
MAGMALLAGVLLGLVPAIGLRRNRLVRGATPGSAAETRGTRRVRAGLVTAQVALSTVLLTGAVLLGASLMRLLRVDSGFDHERPNFSASHTATGRWFCTACSGID